MTTNETLTILASETIRQFKDAGMKIATAESCTGGLISGYLTAIAGSSAVVDRGYVTYSNEAKIELLGVDAYKIESEGAVSAATASQMAVGALERSNAQASVAVTGIAGPGGGTEEKPVGLVFIAVATHDSPGAFVEEFHFGDIGRDMVRNETVSAALEMLLGYAIDDEIDNQN